MIRFEILLNVNRQYYWRLVASNNEIVCWSESYTSKQNALNSIQFVKQWALSAPIHDLA